ncbi:MAG TPA: hypothetical protein VFD22_06425 [Gemmatimonadaceae bacterium]|nr:hypothetical protein [Gemmatimonadaceae bacterium]
MILRRYWLPLALSAGAIGLSGRVPAIQDASTNTAPTGVSLDLPAAYVITSPFSRALDALTLLSNPQSIATLVTVALIVIVWLGLSRQHKTWKWWTARVVLLVVIIAVIEGAVAFLPRPMARLDAADPNVAVIDFHSHTGASHDVRKSFGVGDNRSWHAGGGFDAAWITDHVKFDAAVAARSGNPQRAGDGVSLLTGVEGRYHKIMSTIMLGLDERDTALLNKRGNLLPGSPARGRTPYTIVALPNRNLDSVTRASLDSIPHFAAIELIDAAPRGLGQFDREETRIRDIAQELGLTLVAASNNHGFGRAVAAWNLIGIPGWQNLTPEQLAGSIENLLPRIAPRIVMRTRPRTHDASLPLTLPVIAYQTLGSLTFAERVSWLAWIWGVALLVSLRRSTGTTETTETA